MNNQQESFTAQHDALAIRQVFKDVFSYPIVKQEGPLNHQRLKESQRFLEKDEVIYDENGRPITPKKSERSSTKGGRTPKDKRNRKLTPRGVNQDFTPDLSTRQSNQKTSIMFEPNTRVLFTHSSDNEDSSSPQKTSVLQTTKFTEQDSSDAYVQQEIQLKDLTVDNRNSFEKAIVYAVAADREHASQESKLIFNTVYRD